MIFQCRHCGSKKYWRLCDSNYRCQNCRRNSKGYLVTNIRLTNKEWTKLINLFLIGANGPVISQQLGRSQAMIGKALRLLRTLMSKDIPDVFEGTVEVDEAYLGGQKKKKNKSQLKKEIEIFGKESKRGFGTTKQPVFGILCRNGKVFAESSVHKTVGFFQK